MTKYEMNYIWLKIQLQKAVEKIGISFLFVNKSLCFCLYMYDYTKFVGWWKYQRIKLYLHKKKLYDNQQNPTRPLLKHVAHFCISQKVSEIIGPLRSNKFNFHWKFALAYVVLFLQCLQSSQPKSKRKHFIVK